MNSVQKKICSACVGLYVALISIQSFAYGGWGGWIVPSDTVLSSEEPVTITLDFSVSNDVPTMAKMMASTRLRSVSPSGKINDNTSIVSLGRKSVAELVLEESGTYRISVEQDPMHFVTFTRQDGSSRRIFGKLKDVELPEGAKDVESVTLINRVQTFVTRNGLTHENMQPQKDGLDVSSYIHPNELFSKQKNKYTLFFNGKPLANKYIKITRGGTRYRNDRELIERTSNENGRFEIQWPEAGIYVLEAKMSEKTEQGTLSYGLYLTLEVHSE